MESFYGGHAGVSFVLREAFPSRDEMVAAFKQGRNYTDVWFGEYCVIATSNLNDKENGEVYRRGVNYGAPLGGAEYIGQFVGPQSGTPYFEVEPLGEMQSEFDTEASALFSAFETSESVINETEVTSYPSDYDKQYHYLAKISEDSEVKAWATDTSTQSTKLQPSANTDIITAYGDGKNGQVTVVKRGKDSQGNPTTDTSVYASYGDDKTASEAIMRKKINTDGSSDFVKPYVAQFTPSGGLVRGDTHDSVDISWFNVRANSPESDSYIKVGLQIPYNVFNFITKATSPYDDKGNLKSSEGSTEGPNKKLFTVYQTEEQQKYMKSHPFHQKWTVENAKGIKGDSLHDLRIEKYSVFMQSNVQAASAKNWLVKTNSATEFNQNKYTTVYDSELIETAKHTASNTTFYDASTTRYLYENIVGDTNNLFIQRFSDYFNQTCYYHVDLGSLDSETSREEFTKKASQYNDAYKYIPNVEVMVADLYVYDKVQKPIAIPIFIGFVKQISSITFDSTTGKLTITYTNGTSKTFILAYVDQVKLNSDDGQFSYKKLDGTVDGTWNNGARLQWVKDLVVADDGKVYLSKTTNNKDSAFNLSVNGKTVTLERAEYTGQKVRWIDELLQTKDSSGRIVDDGVIDFKYNTKDDNGSNEHGKFYINYPTNIELSDNINDSKLLNITYTDPKVDGAVKKSGTIGDPVNSIADSFVGEDWYLYILYTAPERRPVASAVDNYADIVSGKTTLNRTMSIICENANTSSPTYRFIYKTKNQGDGEVHNIIYTEPIAGSTESYKLEYEKLPYITNKNWCLDPVELVGSRTVGNDLSTQTLDKWKGKKLFWQKIGPIRDDSGPYLGYHLTNERMNRRNKDKYVITYTPGYDDDASVIVPNKGTDRYTTSQIVDFLNTYFKNGLISENINKDFISEALPPMESKYEGKMIYYTPGTAKSYDKGGEDQTTAWLFQYDYTYYVNSTDTSDRQYGGWTYVGQLGSAASQNPCDIYSKEQNFESSVKNSGGLSSPGFGFYAQSTMQECGWYDGTARKYHGILTNVWDTANEEQAVYTFKTDVAVDDR